MMSYRIVAKDDWLLKGYVLEVAIFEHLRVSRANVFFNGWFSCQWPFKATNAEIPCVILHFLNTVLWHNVTCIKHFCGDMFFGSPRPRKYFSTNFSKKIFAQENFPNCDSWCLILWWSVQGKEFSMYCWHPVGLLAALVRPALWAPPQRSIWSRKTVPANWLMLVCRVCDEKTSEVYQRNTFLLLWVLWTRCCCQAHVIGGEQVRFYTFSYDSKCVIRR